MRPDNPELFCKNLKATLKTLDPRIQDVTQIPDSENAYAVTYKHATVFITSDEIVPKGVLSSGTMEGIGIASMITAMKMKSVSFFYCDEKFSHIHSDAEKAFLSLFIDLLNGDTQLFFTSHNLDILDMNLPKHSFAFLKRDEDNNISCSFASDYLKKNSDSVKNAMENDLFSASPDVEKIYSLLEVK